MDEGQLPRRLRRFQRKNEPLPEEAVAAAKPEKKELSQEETMGLALKEVEKFKLQYNRLPKKEEYDNIAENIYSQLKEEEKRERLATRPERKVLLPEEETASGILNPAERVRLRRQAQMEKQAAKQPDADSADRKQRALAELRKAAGGEGGGYGKGFSGGKNGLAQGKGGLGKESQVGIGIEDVFAKEKAKKKAEEQLGFGGFEEEEGESEGSEFSLDDLGSGSEEGQAEDKCPNCKRPAGDIIFCPECGTAFCEKCAKKTEIAAGSRIAVCPGCSTRVKR